MRIILQGSNDKKTWIDLIEYDTRDGCYLFPNSPYKYHREVPINEEGNT